MVLGHAACGAVGAAIKSIQDGTTLPGHLPSLVDAIAPAVKAVQDRGGDILTNAIRRNASLNADKLKFSEPVLSVSRAKFTSEAVKKPSARIKKSPTPYSCRKSKYAVTKATTTSIDVMMALITAKRIDLLSSAARRLRRGISAFNCIP
jgi:hypothetical protein